MMRRLITLVALLAAASVSPASAAKDENAARLVQISVTRQETDPFLPWQNDPPDKLFGYGVVVRKNIILTTESMVRNNRLIEITLPGSGKKLAARLMLADIQANLALLELLDKADALPDSELALSDVLPLETKATIYQTDDTSAIQICEGTVLQISMARVSEASFLSLTYKLLTKPAVYSQGAPVFLDGRLAGITVNMGRSEQDCLMIPSAVISRFLEDAKEPPYSGFPAAGFMWTELVDPAKRKFFGLPGDDEQGIQVLSTIPGSGAAEKLQANDVILSIDGAAVDSLGFYQDTTYGRLLFPYLISGRKSAGDSISMTVLRNRQQVDLTIPLSQWKDSSSLIPEDYAAEMNDYVISGGLVLRELSGRYLRAHGGDWQLMVGARLAYYYETMRASPKKAGDRIVVLAGILPDTVNIGYHNIRNEIVTHVNGREIRNMDDVFKAIDEEKGLRTIGLMSMDIDLVFDAEKLDEANRRILSSYRIPAINSRDLKQLLESDQAR
jgi:S1-C subfamily serine protease